MILEFPDDNENNGPPTQRNAKDLALTLQYIINRHRLRVIKFDQI